MELFNEKGCLTNEGLLALTQGQLDELGRLESAEHLAYCDRCLKRYTDLLSGDELLQAPTDLVAPVRRSLMLDLMRSTWGRMTVAAAAVVLAFGMWHGGFFDYSGLGQKAPALPAVSQSSAFSQAGDALSSVFGSLRQGLNQVFTMTQSTQQEGTSHAS